MPARVQSMCPDCGKVFLKKNLWPHLAFVHRHTKQEVLRIREQINTEMGVNKVTCPLCEENLFATFKDLAQHCQQTHAENGAGGLPQDYSVFSLKFDNEQQYTVCRAFMALVYLSCNRGGSGKRCSVATIRKTTSKKVVLHCSCYLLAAFNDDGTVDVEGCFGHVGHNVDPALIRRTKSQKILLAQIRQEKRQQVIDEIKRTYAVLEAKVTSLGKVDTHEALLELKQALAHLQLAVEAVHGPETASPVAQLEIMRIKAKRKLSEVPLCQRGKLKKMKRMSKENEMITNDDHDKEQEDADH
ncbi:hypothetical protein Q1695_004303 [Nippostrongylus brasiliensis]|nr:hypothetical protein Q1695_004303 [Nippostrongylus brasiliensis]